MKSSQVFHPEPGSQQGEFNAWILTSCVMAIDLVLFWRSGAFPIWLTLLTGFLLLSAISISLSHWMDRKTSLELTPEGVQFYNGLRNVHFSWDEIEQVRVIPDRWGRRVFVSGTAASFNFRMLSQIELSGKVGGQMGFPAGETILENILKSSGLCLAEKNKQGQYYARP